MFVVRVFGPKNSDDEHLEVEAHKARERQAIRDMVNGIETIEVDMSKSEPPPLPPTRPNILLSDPTFEGILTHFEDGNPSIGIFADEGGSFFGGYGMSRDNKLKTATGFSKMWDGAPINRTRAGSPQMTFYGKRSALHLMVQPQIARDVLADPVLKDQGFLSRLLIAWPESTIGARLVPCPIQSSRYIEAADRNLSRFNDRILELLSMEPSTREHRPMELTPRALPFTAEALKLLRKFANEIEIDQCNGGPLAHITGFASKAAEQAMRISGVMAIFSDETTDIIGGEVVGNAIQLTQWYTKEISRLLDIGYVEPLVLDAQLLLDWLQTKWAETYIDVRTVVQRGPSAIRDTIKVRGLLCYLEKENWLRKCDGPVHVLGKTVHDAWEIP